MFTGILCVVNSTLGSSLPAGATKYISEYYHVTNEQQLVLPISLFLVGYVFGPLVFGPLSEAYGRKIILLSTFVVFTAFTLACALSPNWPALLVFRLIVGTAASSPISIIGGLFADIHSDPRKRGRAMAYFMGATTLGPILGPVISGFISAISWRWTFWVGLIFAGVTLPLVCFCPETYAPIILRRRAEKLRKETGNDNLFAPKELEKKGAKQLITVTLTRPVRMIIYEAVVLFTCLYLSLAYAIFYMYFEAYPIVFQG
jgi:multidrug resistance protein